MIIEEQTATLAIAAERTSPGVLHLFFEPRAR